jgi:hypothetical protein
MARHPGWRLVAVLLAGVADSMVVSDPARPGVELRGGTSRASDG